MDKHNLPMYSSFPLPIIFPPVFYTNCHPRLVQLEHLRQQYSVWHHPKNNVFFWHAGAHLVDYTELS
jgi:hypothetical protein